MAAKGCHTVHSVIRGVLSALASECRSLHAWNQVSAAGVGCEAHLMPQSGKKCKTFRKIAPQSLKQWVKVGRQAK